MDHPGLRDVRDFSPWSSRISAHLEPVDGKILGNTISGMTELGSFLIPIIAFMLGYATIIGEIERGSMSSLLSLSATRFEIVVGKFLGLGACPVLYDFCWIW